MAGPGVAGAAAGAAGAGAAAGARVSFVATSGAQARCNKRGGAPSGSSPSGQSLHPLCNRLASTCYGNYHACIALAALGNCGMLAALCLPSS